MIDFKKIEAVKLSTGSHDNPKDGLCFMEMVAWFEGENHSDRPQCACPVLGRYGIGLNDKMPDDIRNDLLLPLVPKMAGTRCPSDELKRAEFIAIQTVNRILPIVLDGVVDNHIIQKCINANTLEDCVDAAMDAYVDASTRAVNFAAFVSDNVANAKTVSNAKTASYVVRAAARAVKTARAAARAAAFADEAAAEAAIAASEADTALNDNVDCSNSIWQISVNILEKAIVLGRHDGFSQIVELPKRTDALLDMYEKVLV